MNRKQKQKGQSFSWEAGNQHGANQFLVTGQSGGSSALVLSNSLGEGTYHITRFLKQNNTALWCHPEFHA